MIRVAHVITGLGTGGAETMLWRLLSALDDTAFENLVVSLAPEGPMAQRIRDLGVPVTSLNLRADIGALFGIFRLRSLLSRWEPDVVHTWMYHADLLGSAAARLLGVPVVWGLHNVNTDREHTPGRHLRLIRLLARLSHRLPAKIISCSHAARDAHERMGYAPSRLTVIPNGFDMGQFRPDQQLRQAARHAWQIGPTHFVVGNIGRFHPHKDHQTFVSAAALVRSSDASVRFVLYGDGVTMENSELRTWITDAGLTDSCLTLGPNPEVWKIIPGLDLLVSSSRTEAFPLIVGEAMACAVPCIVTDVGDSGWLVGESDAVVPPGRPDALATAILRLAALNVTERQEQGRRARERIAQMFSLPSVASRYAEVYREVCRWNGPALP